MAKSIKIRKGLDINLVGEAEKVIEDMPMSATFAIKPTDFHGIVPKLNCKTGDTVKAGSSLFYDKNNPDIHFVSPVSGTVAEIARGAKRKILAVVVNPDTTITYETADITKVKDLSEAELKQFLMKSGLWPFIKMRPLDVIANPKDTPKSIFISGFDSHPLAPDYDFVLQGKETSFQAGVDALNKLTKGNVNLQLQNANSILKNTSGVIINTVSGPHPAGNVGVQIHHIDPINKGDIIWTLNALDVAIIGDFILTGKFDATRLVALTGANAKNQKYYRTLIGASIHSLVSDNAVPNGDTRIISGNPLTGDTIDEGGYLGYYHSQVSALPEGNQYKFFLTEGWLGLGLKRFSKSRAYPTWLMPKSRKYNLDTNLNGEERAFVVTEQYEEVFPFDIYPVHLVKAAITNDIDNMEKLGIYEVAPEDFALCEFVCTSKIASQQIIREGLDLVKKECF